MNTQRARLRRTHRHCFRPNVWADVVGVVMMHHQDDLDPWPCFVVMFDDGTVDFTAVSDTDNYEIEAAP